MKITLKPDQEKFIEAQVTSGRYPSPEEVIAAALELLAENSETKKSNSYQKWVEETRPKVATGIAQLDRGEGIDGEIVIAKLQEKFRKMRENQI
ncbi:MULTISPECIES: type II toxin-antitoxin system ParD family antitoxin [unclassified Microcoleus]|uniref:ribbon-helix-helix domain-containing protein n=1 Tax=unclassified Microcoleus TaxID=2642155 RepID=UPI0025EE4D77|nr:MULTISPECIES: type II toxin-antitoxin system ParD family antitoxin [unclassified Microcoleus]